MILAIRTPKKGSLIVVTPHVVLWEVPAALAPAARGLQGWRPFATADLKAAEGRVGGGTVDVQGCQGSEGSGGQSRGGDGGRPRMPRVQITKMLCVCVCVCLSVCVCVCVCVCVWALCLES